jgi:hypothetical protein
MPIAHLNFRRHFVLLACALAVVVILAQFDIFGVSSLLPDAAIYGALHAIALSGALDLSATLARKSLFILLAAALDVAVLYIGIFSAALLSTVPVGLNVRAYLALGVCSLAGAICYGLLIRHFWLPVLTPRPIVRISLGCLIATLLALLLENLSGLISLWALAAVWWCTFSSGLWLFGRTYPLRPDAHA